MKNTKWTISLRTIVALVICVSIFLLSLLHMYQAYEGMKLGILSITKVMAQYLSVSGTHTIKTTFTPSSVTLRLLKHEKITEAVTLEDRLTALPILAEVLDANPICSAIFIGYDVGDFFLLRRFKDPHPLVIVPAPAGSAYLLQTITCQASGSFLAQLYFYSSSFEFLERRVVDNYRFDPRTRPWYKEAIQSDRIEITPPYIFFSTKEIGMTIAVKDPRGRSVVAMDTTAEDFSVFLSSLRITPDSEIAVVSDTGKVVAYPNIDRLFIKEANGYRLPQLNELNVPALDNLLRANMPDNILTEFNDGTKNWYGLTATFSSLTGKDLKILIAIPSDALLAGVWRQLIQQSFAVALSMGLLLVFGWWLGTRLVQPLHKLTAQVHSLGEFNFDTPIGVDTRVREVRELGGVLGNMAETISNFQNLSLTLNKEKDLERMLKAVLEQLLKIVRMKIGAIYLYDGKEDILRVFVSQGEGIIDAIPISCGNATDKELEKEIQSRIGGNYILSILRSRGQILVGVLTIRCREPDMELVKDAFGPFVNKIAGSAAVAIETRQLIQTQKALLDSIIKLIADAIDTKSHYTGGHCLRVPVLATMIMDKISQTQEAPFSGYSLSDLQQEEFRIAAWLHDCGKITTPEYVVDKATKLETINNRIHEVRMRFEVLHRDASIVYLEALSDGKDREQARKARDAEYARLQEDFAFIAHCNIGGEFMETDDIERLGGIAERTWLRYFSDRLGLSKDELSRVSRLTENETLPVVEKLLADKKFHIVPWRDGIPPVQESDAGNKLGFRMKPTQYMYNYGEVYNLTVKKGTLTEEERFKINNHIIQTISMLSSLPLPYELRNVPNIAGNHHERMDGQGYPRGLSGETMTLSERVMAVADIFEALTAFDRPYKDGKTLSQALRILSQMAKERHIDSDIFNLFLRSGIYLEYAKQYLYPEQIDEVLIEDFLL